MLKQLGQDIWTADGCDIAVIGFHYPTRMAIIRLADGGLFVWSPIALSEELRTQVDALGPVRHIIAPNSLHHLSIADWKRAYPDARVYAPPGLRKKRRDIAFDGDLKNTPDPHWAGDIDQVIVPGNLITTEVVFFHIKSGTVLFTDLLQQFPPDAHSGWRGIVAKLDLMVAPEPSVPRKFRVAFVNRRAARAAIQHILAWPAKSVVMAHGTPVKEDAKAFLARAFVWLTG